MLQLLQAQHELFDVGTGFAHGVRGLVISHQQGLQFAETFGHGFVDIVFRIE